MAEVKKDFEDFVKEVFIWYSTDGIVKFAEHMSRPNARITFSGLTHRPIKIEELK